MPFEPDSGAGRASGGGGRFVPDAAPSQADNRGVIKQATDAALVAASGIGQGILGEQAGLGTFIQAPAASALSGVLGARALADRGVTWLQNNLLPGDKQAKLDDDVQQAAQDASAYAQWQREQNIAVNDGSWANPRTALARLGVGLVEDARARSAEDKAATESAVPELVRQQRHQAQAEGFWENLKAVAQDPLATLHTLARSAPDMGLGLAVSRAAAEATMSKAGQVADAATKAAAAAGADVAGQAAAAQSALAKLSEKAVARAGTAGMIAEPASTLYTTREQVYQQVVQTPPDQLQANSPRFRELLLTTKGDAFRAREILANELADQGAGLAAAGTLAGSTATRGLGHVPGLRGAYGDNVTAKAVAGVEKLTAKDVGRNILQESTEEGLQGVPEDLAQYGATVQADQTQKFDPMGSLAQNMSAGALMSGPGTTSAYAWQRAKELRAGRGGFAADAPAPPPAGAAGAVNADEVLGADPQNPAEVALHKPRPLTALDRVAEIDKQLADAPDSADAPTLQAERAALTKDWPKTVPGNPTTISTEAGATVEGRYALIEAADAQPSHDIDLRPNPAYPAELQPRDRTRAASEAQIASIVGRLDPARLGLSQTAADGAPIIGEDGLVESGNARTIAMQRVYRANGLKADAYRSWLRDNASQFGLDPAQVESMQQPLLVRVRTTPVDRAEFARQSNAPTVAAMSPLEQARSDAARIDSMDDLQPDDSGDFATSRDFIRRFVGRLPATERAGMIDASGRLSSSGYARVRNAVLAKAYGDSPVLGRMVESNDDNLRNVSKALMLAAPRVAKARSAIDAGHLHDADITPHLVSAVEALGQIKDQGGSVADALAQTDLTGDKLTPETRELLQFLADNARSPRRMADFVTAYFDALEAMGNPNQGSLLGEAPAPTTGELLTGVSRSTMEAANADSQDTRRGHSGKAAPGSVGVPSQPADAPGGRRGNQGNEAPGVAANEPGGGEWQSFGPETGTLGVPRAEMPQVRVAKRGDLLAFLEGRGIGHRRVSLPADTLKPTQAEYSRAKTDSAAHMAGEQTDRAAVLVSSDGYVLDGHHRWLASAEAHAPVWAIQFDAPIGRLLDAVMQFPDTHVSKESAGAVTPSARDLAVADLRDAVGELGDFLTRHMRAAIVAEDKPRLMPIMVKAADAAIRIVGTDLRRVVAWMRDHFRRNKGTLPGWNMIPAAWYKDAAEKAMLSRGAVGGIAVPALQAVASRVASRLEGLPTVHVLASPAEAPAALRAYIEARGATADVEGALHDGAIYLFASGIEDETRAEHVLAEHEAAHAGLAAMLGAGRQQAMQALFNQNAEVRRAAKPMIDAGMALAEAVEEVIVDIPSAQLARLKGWRLLVGKMRDALARLGFERVAAQLDGWLAGHLTEQQRADLAVADLVRAARGFVAKQRTATIADDATAQAAWLAKEAKARGFSSVDDLAARNVALFEKLAETWRRKHPAAAMLATRLSVATAGSVPPAQPPGNADARAEKIIQTAAGTPKPLDALARGFTRFTGIERAAAFTYDKGGRLIDLLTPEVVKAGMWSDYGVPEAVIDSRAVMTGRERGQLRKAGELLDKLATMTRAESRVAYEWMTGEDTRTADQMMQALPAESVKVLREIRTMIDDLSQEAVRQGQLDPEAFKRHRYAYLSRLYYKHEKLGATGSEMTLAGRREKMRTISILGDQYKGRGIVKAAAMKQIQAIAPEWWKRKLVPGKADPSLKGEKFERLERRAPAGAGTDPLAGVEPGGAKPKVLEVHYWPASEPKPAKYADWHSTGVFEAINTKGADVVLWRDFTKAEREQMGEIDEARYAIAKTLQRMIHDVEVGRYLEWLSQNHAKLPGETIDGSIVEPGRNLESYRSVFKPGEWVRVPDTKIPQTDVHKYGKLAGQYLPGPIWNDLRQVVGGQFMPLGETYHQIQRAWKASKTALSPVVHTNNVMSNFVMADWHDVSAGHVAKALRIVLAASDGKGKGLIGRAGNVAGQLGIADREAARAIIARYQDSGGAIGGWVTQEIVNEQLAPIVEALQRELATTAAAAAPAEIGVYSALQHALHARFPQAAAALRASKPVSAAATEGKSMLALYQAEDDVFRLAAWLKAKEEGKTDPEAGKIARRSFMDYSINAPWIAALRGSALPFVSYTYRALPMLLETAGKRPHKLMKLMLVAGALNALFSMIAGGGGDDERKLLPEEKAGRVWGIVPKLIRMPWNDKNGSPVFLDIRRWIPLGDVFDIGQGHSALPLPPALTPGGPLVILGELIFNRSMFTGKPIVLEGTDTATEWASKLALHAWQAAAPNIALLPGTYAWQSVADAARGKTDAFGREQSVGQALASSIGVKLGSYPADVLRRNLEAKAKAEIAEIDHVLAGLKRQRMTNSIDQDEYEAAVRYQRDKQRKVMDDLRERVD